MEQHIVELASGARVEVTHLSAEEGQRHMVYLANSGRLVEMAHRALGRGLRPEQLVLVCINVNEPAWRGLVEALMPGNEPEWERRRECGEVPFARGVALREGLKDIVLTRCPGMAAAFDAPVSQEALLCLVMHAEGVTGYRLGLT